MQVGSPIMMKGRPNLHWEKHCPISSANLWVCSATSCDPTGAGILDNQGCAINISDTKLSLVWPLRETESLATSLFVHFRKNNNNISFETVNLWDLHRDKIFFLLSVKDCCSIAEPLFSNCQPLRPSGREHTYSLSVSGLRFCQGLVINPEALFLWISLGSFVDKRLLDPSKRNNIFLLKVVHHRCQAIAFRELSFFTGRGGRLSVIAGRQILNICTPCVRQFNYKIRFPVIWILPLELP